MVKQVNGTWCSPSLDSLEGTNIELSGLLCNSFKTTSKIWCSLGPSTVQLNNLHHLERLFKKRSETERLTCDS